MMNNHVNVAFDLPESVYQELNTIATRRNISIDTVLSRAVQLELTYEQAIDKNEKVLIQGSNKQLSELHFNK